MELYCNLESVLTWFLHHAVLQDGSAMPNAILQGAIAEIVYRKAVEALPEDVNFLVSLVKICSEFPFTQKLQGTMYQQWVQLKLIHLRTISYWCILHTPSLHQYTT